MYEWDEKKNDDNFLKHGLSFDDAHKVFDGPCLTFEDTRFEYDEERFLSFRLPGRSPRGDRPHTARREHPNHLDEKGK